MIKLNIGIEAEDSGELEMALVSLRKLKEVCYYPNPAWDPRILKNNEELNVQLDGESKNRGAAPKNMDDLITFGASSL